MNDQDRRTLLAVVLAFITFYLWSIFFAPPEQTAEAPVETPATTSGEVPVATSASENPKASIEQECKNTGLKKSFTQAEFEASDCGGLRGMVLPEVEAAMHVTPWWSWIWGLVTGSMEGSWTPYRATGEVERLISTEGQFARAGVGDPLKSQNFQWQLAEIPGGLRFTGKDAGVMITETLKETPDPDLFSIHVRWEAPSGSSGPFWIGYRDNIVTSGTVYDPYLRIEAVVDEDLEQLLNPLDARERQRWVGPLDWFGTTDRYFLAALIPQSKADWSGVQIQYQDPYTFVWTTSTKLSLASGEALESEFKLYLGKKDVERLSQLDSGLEEAAQLGFFGFFGKILLFFLHLFHMAIQDWGLSIIALTFFVRASLYPLAAKAFKNAKAMQVLQPKLKELQELYKEDKDRLNQETMKLFMEHQVNPVGGCLPLLVQMPVFFALYSALQVTPDLYHQRFLYVQDLSAPDPYGVFPALMAAGMIIQQQMTPMTGMDPVQQRMMKLMPFMFALFMFTVPAGLAVYYTINTALSILQQWYNTRSYELSNTAR
jgi:YidC/Oxa1 family membrane protein insertase